MIRATVCGTLLATTLALAPGIAAADEPVAPLPSAAAPAAPAQTAPPATAPTDAPAAAAPVAAAAPEAPPIAPVERDRLRAFSSLRLRYDARSGEAYEGSSTAPLARDTLFARLGRQDLIDADASRRTARTYLFIGAGAAVVAGVVAGLVIFENGPTINSAACEQSGQNAYNQCIDDHKRANMLSGVSIVAGALVGTGLLSFGLSLGKSPLPARETESLVANYNGELMKRLRSSGAPPSPGTRLEISPQMSASGGGLTGRLTF